MINKDKWMSTVPKINNGFNEEINRLDHSRWVPALPKKNTYGSIKKYSLVTVLFVSGILLVSAVKNETRNLQKEINNLQTTTNLLKFNLDQAILDNEVITSPENITRLAKEYLSTDFVFYKKSQIKQLYYETKTITKLDKNINNKKNKNLKEKIKLQVAQKVVKQKKEIKKIQEFYSKPKLLPGKIKTKVAKKIEKKKVGFTNIYSSPQDSINLAKIQRWTAIQVVKAFLGIPIVPGK